MSQVKRTSYKRGTSGNPEGRRIVMGLNRKVRLLNKYEFELAATELLHLTREEFKELSQKQELPMIKVLLISLIQKAIYDQDPSRLSILLDRMFGKVVDRHKIEGEVTVKELSVKEIRHIIQADPFFTEIEHGSNRPKPDSVLKLQEAVIATTGTSIDSNEDRSGEGHASPKLSTPGGKNRKTPKP